MKKVNMGKAIERYNSLMEMICWEHNTIGTRFSEDTENWNLRDMVAECDYALSTYYEVGHVNEEMRTGDADDRKCWRSETGKLRRFIKAYEPFIGGLECASGHYSQYD